MLPKEMIDCIFDFQNIQNWFKFHMFFCLICFDVKVVLYNRKLLKYGLGVCLLNWWRVCNRSLKFTCIFLSIFEFVNIIVTNNYRFRQKWSYRYCHYSQCTFWYALATIGFGRSTFCTSTQTKLVSDKFQDKTLGAQMRGTVVQDIARLSEDPVQTVLLVHKSFLGHAGVRLGLADTSHQCTCTIYTVCLVVWQPRQATVM